MNSYSPLLLQLFHSSGQGVLVLSTAIFSSNTVIPMILSPWHSLKRYISANEFQIFSPAQASLADFRLTYPTACPATPLGFLADNSNLTCLKLKRLPEICSIHSALHLRGCQLPAFYGSDQKSWIAFDSSPSHGLSVVDHVVSDFKIYREPNQIWNKTPIPPLPLKFKLKSLLA